MAAHIAAWWELRRDDEIGSGRVAKPKGPGVHAVRLFQDLEGRGQPLGRHDRANAAGPDPDASGIWIGRF